jgi:hypothetical protein
MTDAAVCVAMDLGPPRVTLDALSKLAAVLERMSTPAPTG